MIDRSCNYCRQINILNDTFLESFNFCKATSAFKYQLCRPLFDNNICTEDYLKGAATSKASESETPAPNILSLIGSNENKKTDVS